MYVCIDILISLRKMINDLEDGRLYHYVQLTGFSLGFFYLGGEASDVMSALDVLFSKRSLYSYVLLITALVLYNNTQIHVGEFKISKLFGGREAGILSWIELSLVTCYFDFAMHGYLSYICSGIFHH